MLTVWIFGLCFALALMAGVWLLRGLDKLCPKRPVYGEDLQFDHLYAFTPTPHVGMGEQFRGR